MEMNPAQSALWRKLASFDINEGGETSTFEHRLARENGWDLVYTRRVVAEYRKFVFLCAAAGHPCSPSEPVDEAWHLHLLYTRSYWERLCPLLPAPLHHQPSKGGPAESAKFDEWYQRTLDSYRRFFGEEPPRDVWPSVAERFVETAPLLNRQEHLVIPRRVLRRTGWAGLAVGVALLTTLGWTGAVAEIGGEGLAFAFVGLLFLGGIFSAIFKVANDTFFDRKSVCGNDPSGFSGGFGGGPSCGGDSGGGGGCGSSGCGGGGCGGGGGGGCGGGGS